MTALTDVIRDAIATAYAVDGSTRDAIIVGLVTDHKLTLNAATKAYAEWAKEEGIAPTLTSHKDEALDYLADKYHGEFWDAAAVKDEVIIMADRFNVAESTARDYAKAYSEQLGVTHPVLNPREAIFQWFKDQGDTATKEEFMDFAVDELGRSQSNANEYWKGYELHLFLVA